MESGSTSKVARSPMARFGARSPSELVRRASDAGIIADVSSALCPFMGGDCASARCAFWIRSVDDGICGLVADTVLSLASRLGIDGDGGVLEPKVEV